MREAACLGGADRSCWAETRFMRSQICCSVGARVIEARCSGKRVPGGSEVIFSQNRVVRSEYRTASFIQKKDASFLRDLVSQWSID